MVMCTHLHHDHLGWNTQLRGRHAGSRRFPTPAMCSQSRISIIFTKLDNDPATAPAEFGTFRECVLPVVEAGRADLVTGPHRLDEFIDIQPAPRPLAGTFRFQARCRRPPRDDDRRRLPSSAAGLLSGLEFPEELECRGCAASAAAACWRIARRPARWFSRAMSARRSPAISRRSDRRFSRASDRSASPRTTLASRRGRFADHDVVDGQLAAVAAPARDRTRLSTPAAPRR